MKKTKKAGQRIIASARQALAFARGETDGRDARSRVDGRSFATLQLSEQEVAAIASSRMSCEHDHLNALVDAESKPEGSLTPRV
jgi:hypothetical protein